ncbi:glycosyltransferase family 9 protein [Candidatus Saganbacteria bacterium]|nr:glycosyltransferase family 9 protein [Candidatus Saganbacteria bacterium]
MISVNKILAIRPDAIGDGLLITPALSLLKQKFPASEITVLARGYSRAVFARNLEVSEVIEEIGDHKFDLSIHFYNELPYVLAARKAGIKYRLGDTAKPLLRPFYNLKSDRRWSDLTLHEVEHNILLLKPLGIDLPETPPPLQLGVKPRPQGNTIGIHLGTGRGNRAWLPERFARVADHLAEKGARVVLTGSGKEIDAANKILSLCRSHPVNMVNKTTLPELIDLIATYSMYIGVDTGPLHIAAALKIPTVAIFPSKFVKPSEWGPWQTRHVIVRKASQCRQKCLPADCPFDDCLKEITVEDVIEGIETIRAGGGNLNLAEARLDWFKRSANILTNRDEIVRELSYNGFNAVKLENALSLRGLLRQITLEDINIIHWVGHASSPALILARLFSIPQTPIPPLLISEKERRDFSASTLLGYYIGRFKGRNYL